MPQVQVGLTAGWLTQEAVLPRAPLPGSEPYAPGSFDRHLEQAQKLASPAGDRAAPAPAAAPPAPSTSLDSEDRSQAREDDSARSSSLPQSPLPKAATDSSEDGAAEDEHRASADEDRNAEQEPCDVSEAALDAGASAAAEASQRRPEDEVLQSPHASPGWPASSARADAKTPPAHAVAGKRPGAGGAAADAQSMDTDAERKTELDGVANSDGGTDRAHSGENVEARTGHEAAQAERAAVSAADRPPAASGEHITSPATQPGADVQAAPTEPAPQTAQPVSTSRQELPADGRATEGGARAAARPGTHALKGPQISQQQVEAAGPDDSVPPEAAVRPGNSETPQANVLAADGHNEVPEGRSSANSAGDAGAAEPNASSAATSRTFDAVGRRNEEAASADGSDRAQFVQRVARAFESAADRGGHVRLRLYPPELGSLRLDLTVRNGLMSARLETETESARNMLLESLPALKERLAGHQIQVERFDIECRGQTQGGLPQRSGDHDRRQPPSPGRAPHMPGVASGGPGQNEIVARRLNAGTSFDVVI